MESFGPLLNSPFVSNIRLIANGDIGEFDSAQFNKSLWCDHIQSIYPILALNIARSSIDSKRILKKLLGEEPVKVFPARELRPAEESCLFKHFYSLSKTSNVALTIEDDAQWSSRSVEQIHNLAKISYENNFYIDLGCISAEASPPTLYQGKIQEQSIEYKSTNIGLTRTNVAYMVNCEVARLMSSSYWPCALPADLHHQFLLNRLAIKGMQSRRPLVIGQSSVGTTESSTK